MDQREINGVVEFCHSVDELITGDPGASTLEVLEQLRLEMCDKLKLFDYEEAEKIAYHLLLHWLGVYKKA